MAKKKTKKESIPDELGTEAAEDEGMPSDPYLDQLDSSLEDLVDEEPTRYDVPTEKPPQKKEISKPPSAEIPQKPIQDKMTAKQRAVAQLDMATDIPVDLRVVIGDKKTTLAELLKMKKGELMELGKGLDAAVDLMVQDKVVARGELVEIDGRLGVRIISILE
jgi:flagellar motor switch protein FliN/FliY